MSSVLSDVIATLLIYLWRIKRIGVWYYNVENVCRICIRCIWRTTYFTSQLHEAITFQL